MQTLLEVQKAFKSMGLRRNQEPFNQRVLSILVIVFPGLISMWIYLICEADSDNEYMESVYIVTLASGVFLSFATTILITKKLFSFIKSSDEFSNERK